MKLYKHPRCTDVAMCILYRAVSILNQMHYCKVQWFNIVNPENVFAIGKKEYIEIPDYKFKEFELYD